MIFFPTMGRNPIGVDLGARVIKAVQTGRSRGRRVVTASASFARVRPDGPIDLDEVKRLSRVLSRQGFVGRQLVLAAPSEQLMSAVVDMPPRESGAPYHLIAQQEFARLQSQEPGQFQVSWWDIPQPARSSSTKVMTVGCAHADTDPLLDVFEAGGFDVSAMDSGLCAAVRACREQLGSAQSVSAVLDLGWSSARLAIVHGSVVVFDRTLASSGMAGLHKRVCETFSVETDQADCLIQSVGLAPADSDPRQTNNRTHEVAPMLRPIFTSFLEQIAGELRVSFEYASHQYPGAGTHRLILVGGGSAIPGLAEQLDTMITPEVLPAASPVWHPRDDPAKSKARFAPMTAALGLAIYYKQG